MATKAVMVCTKHRGVFFGFMDPAKEEDKHIFLEGAKMAIRFGTTRGVLELANTGPTKDSKISLPADGLVRDVTAVFHVSAEAEKKWVES